MPDDRLHDSAERAVLVESDGGDAGLGRRDWDAVLNRLAYGGGLLTSVARRLHRLARYFEDGLAHVLVAVTEVHRTARDREDVMRIGEWFG